MYLAYRVLPKKNGYHFMKNCNASTHQPAHRKKDLLDTDHVHRHALPFYFFSLLLILPNTSSLIIDFVVLLHWTQQNKTASLRFRLTRQLLKKKKNSMTKFAKLVWLAAVQLFYFLSFFSYIPNKKREEKGPKAIFENEWPKLMYVVMLSRKLNRRCPRSLRLKEYSCNLMLPFCTFTIIHPPCLLPPSADQVA